MLREYFKSPLRVATLSGSPGGPYLEGFADTLHRAGYAEITARKHIRAAEHLFHWAGRTGISISSLNERSLERFGRHFDQCQCPSFGTSYRKESLCGARFFLNYLQDAGVITAPAAETTTQDPALLSAFCRWMRQERGTCGLTLYNYSLPIRDLLNHLGEDPQLYDARSLRHFVLDKNQKCGWATAKRCTTALRMFLRFLIAEGKCAAHLDAAIPSLAHWRLSSLPRYLQPEEVERVINSCDLSRAVGRRDRAILLLLARLGFRAGDVVTLHLTDIDWKDAAIHVSGKGRRQTRLPLTQEVGDAIVAYLQHGRPRTRNEAVFIRSRAPYRAFASHCAISVIVAKAMRRAGVTCPSRGAAHVLRHSAATSMLRHGASLQDIAAILRHRSTATTEIYAKVDLATLRQIAQPWPEVQPC